MYFYVLDSGSYEEYYKTVFFSETEYSHDELMNIIKKAYKSICEEILKRLDNVHRCDAYFDCEYVLWNDDFNSCIETISDLKVIKGHENIYVGTSITTNENTLEIENSILTIIPDCRNNCKERPISKYFCRYEKEVKN